VFVTEIEKKKLGLVYTNGTWFQILGDSDGATTRWSFTHIEIYLRRTFTGTTVEMEKTIEDALAGRKKAPPANSKEKPGFGPEIEPKPGASPQSSNGSTPGVLLGVIALPFLMPIAALLQLLFPGLLRDQWRQYQIAIGVLLSQSTLIFVHWAICTWVVTDAGAHWWLSPTALWVAIVAIAVSGALAAMIRQHRSGGTVMARTPARVEYIALITLVVAGLGWALYQWFTNERPFTDVMGVVTAAATIGVLHLIYRRWRTGGTLSRPSEASEDTLRNPMGCESMARRCSFLTTEIVFLSSMVFVGTALGVYLHRPVAENLQAGQVSSEWTVARGNEARTGALDANDPGPTNPVVLWTFEPKERSGRISFHSSPTFVDGQLYVGAMHSVLSLSRGLIYCVHAADGKQHGDHPIKLGERIWRFSANDSLKPVFSSPIVHAGKIYVGEGYHQDSDCRLFCLDARNGDKELWSFKTSSHVESSPCVIGSRVYFGAGDEGLLCLDAKRLIMEVPRGPDSPMKLWHVPNVHVDASPLVVGDRVFFGTIVGDLHQTLQAMAVDANSGKVLWTTPAPMAVLASPSYASGRLFFGLGNGKLGKDADQPAGAIWCLDAKSGRRLWEYKVGNCVLGTPALMDGNIYFGSTDGFFYCLRQSDGKFLWKVNMQDPIAASPVVAKGKVYVLSTTGVLACFNAADGNQLWRMDDLAEGVSDAFASPILAHGRLYVALGGKVLCVGDR
jgi:outer membrane protein assembly factor BamB